jgi:hypothetical protein
MGESVSFNAREMNHDSKYCYLFTQESYFAVISSFYEINCIFFVTAVLQHVHNVFSFVKHLFI